jgi:hypothetical protein
VREVPVNGAVAAEYQNGIGVRRRAEIVCNCQVNARLPERLNFVR